MAKNPPITSDEYLNLDNVTAKNRMPKELASAAKMRRVSVYLSGKEKTVKMIKSRGVPGTLEFDLPEGSGLVQPGRRSKQLSVTQVRRAIKKNSNTNPFRPTWVDYTPHPKISTATRPLIRRGDGRWVESHYGVFGTDDRQVYYPSGYPWTCVGKVFVWNDFSKPNPAWSGSAVLIGGRVILTAGHIAPWGSSNWAMKFVPAHYDGVSTLGTGVSSWVSDYYGYNTGNNVTAWDMAVCRLYTPLGNTYGYFGAKTYNDSWEGGNYWTLAGYPGAVAGGNRPSRQMWFPTIDDDPDGSATEVEYLADQTAGNSGGPVFGFWSGDPYVIGTASGGEKETVLWWTTEDNNVAAGGSALVNLIKWARSNWPA